jgi:hypothetical protein
MVYLASGRRQPAEVTIKRFIYLKTPYLVVILSLSWHNYIFVLSGH